MKSQSDEIVDICRRMSERQFVANHDGNVTCKYSPGQFLATPTSFAKADVKAVDILTVDKGGQVLKGPHKIFSEIFWHLAIYRARPDIKCVVHAHPPTASAYGLARKELGIPAIPEAVVSLGRSILTSRFFSSLDPAIKEAGSAFESEMGRVLKESDGFIAPGNGVWVVGEGILQTYLRLELIEHVARQHSHAEQLGAVYPLEPALVEELLSKRPVKSAKAVASTSLSQDKIKELVRREIVDILKHES